MCGRNTKTLIFFVLMLFSARAHTQEIYQFYAGARMLGMGGAYTAVVNDETSLLTNPAGLGKIRDLTFTIGDPEIDASKNDTDLFNSSNYNKATDLQGLNDTLKVNPGIHYHSKVQVFPSIVLPNFGLGAFAKSQWDAETDVTGANMTVHYWSDYGMAMGYNFRLFGGVIKYGVVARAFNRVEIDKVIPTSSTGLDIKSQASEGGGIACDMGMIITAPVRTLPAISGVIHDLGDTAYTLTNGSFYSTTTRPKNTQKSVDVGISFSPIVSNRVRAQFAADYHDVTTAGDELDQMKRIHAGLELNIADFLFLRGGMNQRYWTSGVEFATSFVQVQGAYYGEEIGTPTTHKEDRRWVGKISIRF